MQREPATYSLTIQKEYMMLNDEFMLNELLFLYSVPTTCHLTLHYYI